MPRPTFFLRRAPLMGFLVAVLGLGGCGTGLVPGLDEEQEQPHYQLTQADQTWTTPYRVGEEWRFRNAQGYVRRYQVKGLSDRTLPGMLADTYSVKYYQQEIGARLERVDSAYVQRPNKEQFSATFTISAAVADEAQASPLRAQLNWGSTQVSLPVAEASKQQPLPAGVQQLKQLTLGGHTYQNVLEFKNLQTQAGQQAGAVKQVYYTQEKGVVRFVDASGAVWDRD
jgi:hypothetical protein